MVTARITDSEGEKSQRVTEGMLTAKDIITIATSYSEKKNGIGKIREDRKRERQREIKKYSDRERRGKRDRTIDRKE